MDMPDSILCLCAHNDDHVIGAGGTLAKYAREGNDVITVIFSYGEKSHPWLQDKEVVKMRVEESKVADKVIGAKKLYYLGLKEGQFVEGVKDKKLVTKLKRLINVIKPVKIFTHSIDDPHPDHRAVFNTVNDIISSIRHKCDVYSFDIWNPLSIRNRDKPKLVVDVSKTFKFKIRAIQEHKSQWMALAWMIPATYLRGLLNGLDKGVKYAEVFVKLR